MSFRKYYETSTIAGTAERRRLLEDDLVKTWRHWEPYLSDRQWGTVREWSYSRILVTAVGVQAAALG
jgi:hypothetical protein